MLIAYPVSGLIFLKIWYSAAYWPDMAMGITVQSCYGTDMGAVAPLSNDKFESDMKRLHFYIV
jgi:hypothetical protein